MRTAALCAVLFYEVLVAETNVIDLHKLWEVKNKVPGRHGPRIYNGQIAEDGQFPFMVMLTRPLVTDFICSGIYVGPKWVLTAAHCLYNKTLYRTEDMWAYSGQADIDKRQRAKVSKNVQKRGVKSLHVHPEYVFKEFDNYDIGLVELDEEFDESVTFAKLAEERARALHNCTIIGWGTNDRPDGKLRYATGITFHAPEDGCYLSNPDLTVMCCVNVKAGTTPGDSGGPAMCDGLIYGLSSFATIPLNTRPTEMYYTDVAKLHAWIIETMEGISTSAKPNAMLVVLVAVTMTLTTL